MTAKEYLSRALVLNNKINHMIKLYDVLKDEMGYTNKIIDGMPKSPNQSISQVPDQVIRIQEMDEEISKEIDRLIELKKEISGIIWEVEDFQARTILYGRYIAFYSWEKMASDLGYSIRHLHRLHGLALKK